MEGKVHCNLGAYFVLCCYGNTRHGYYHIIIIIIIINLILRKFGELQVGHFGDSVLYDEISKF
jgi:hypothetical protein